MSRHLVSIDKTLSPVKDIDFIVKKCLEEDQNISLKNGLATKNLVRLVRTNTRTIQGIYKDLNRQVATDNNPERQWLLENGRVIFDAALSLGHSLNANLLTRLPVLTHTKTSFRIISILNLLLAHSNFSLNQSRLEAFIGSYQKKQNLTIAELWAVSHLSQGIIADGLCQIMKSIISEAPTAPTNKAREKLISHMVISLQQLQKVNWKGFIEKVSLVEKILRRDPAGIYPKMDFSTRDSYRHEIEEIYYNSNNSQEEIALWTLNQSKKYSKGSYQHHVGYFLAGNGKKYLEKNFKIRTRNTKKILQPLINHITKTYLTMEILATLGLEIIIFFGFKGQLLFPLLLTPPSLFIAHMLINQLMIRAFQPSFLPKMDWELPVEPKNRVMVVVPSLFSGQVDENDRFIETLETTYLSNLDRNIFFGLLLAFPEKTGITGDLSDKEKGQFEGLKTKLDLLNKKYPQSEPIFHFFFRQRLWSPQQNRWIEWERKRGKIMEFNKLLRGQGETNFIFQTASAAFLKTIKYVITMDEDILLPRSAAKKLVATISHPLNQAVIDPKTDQIIDGYGIIQPRISSKKKDGIINDLAISFFSGRSGWDSYSGIISDIYQDVFHEGIFQGNGIYDVDIFYQLLNHRFPQNLLLSHDHIEGYYCRTGNASDIQIFEDFPASYEAYRTRIKRWTRGDWQRLIWSFANKIPNQFGVLIKNPLAIRHRWKLIEDLIFSLIPAVLILTIFLGIVTDQLFTATAIAIVYAVFPPVLTMFDFLLAKKNWLVWRYTFKLLGLNLKSAFLKMGFNLFFLPDQAVAAVSSIIVALGRVYITHKNQLTWTLSQHTSQKKASTLKNSFKQAFPTTIIGGIFVILIILIQPQNTLLAFIVILGWLLAPFLAYLSGQPPHTQKQPLTIEVTNNLLAIAKKTWTYFSTFVNQKTNYLPPDHYQISTQSPVSSRTSITDIGFYLLSTVASFDLGIISQDEMVTHLERTLKSIQKLPRYRGHFFNWYDIAKLTSLPPSYISTVDSGNFVGCLIVVSQALKNTSHSKLAAEVDTIIAKMDFGFLYDKNRDLFRIGYNFNQKQFDKNHYDLLASETRLTSFLAIAQNQVPLRHWLFLGRPTSATHGRLALLSWGGSIFEYLFPLMIMPNSKETLLSESYDTAVQLQISYGKRNRIPWGMSESSYGLKNKDGHYRYKLHGIPPLGLRQIPYKELVISPYSTFLSLEINPKAAYENILQLQKIGSESDYGFYEAIDYTVYGSSASPGNLVKTYLCHHQGAILVSIANFLTNNLIKKRFEQIPMVKSTLVLLDEDLPQFPSLVTAFPAPKNNVVDFFAQTNKEPVEQTKQQYDTPFFHIISNSRCHVVVSNRGKSCTTFGDKKLIDNRWQFIYEETSNQTWGVTHEPMFSKPDRYETSYHLNGMQIIRESFQLQTKLQIAVGSQDNVEVRHLTLKNLSAQKRQLTVFGFGTIFCDPSHPIFYKMKTAIEETRDHGAIRFTQKRPLEESKMAWYKVFSPSGSSVTYATNRFQFFKRGQSLLQIVPPSLKAHSSSIFLPDPVIGFEAKITLDINQKESLYEILTVEPQTEKYLDTSFLDNLINSSTTVSPEHLDESPDVKICQQFLSVLLENAPLPKTIAQTINLPPHQPTIAAQIYEDTSKSFVRQLLRSAFFLSQRGFFLNVVIITHDGDNYFTHVTNLAQDLTNEFESFSTNYNLASPRIMVLKASLLSPKVIADILNYSSASLNGRGKPISVQLEKLANKL